MRPPGVHEFQSTDFTDGTLMRDSSGETFGAGLGMTGGPRTPITSSYSPSSESSRLVSALMPISLMRRDTPSAAV